ncbi:SDR family NAD(P)-dependent oxidoreductase [Cohnella rhizosphaerae]|uniref:SDR family NAD(P)-dependent oxidoreductase n=1 Tax=Cohnella rhizosphaerae TaxID=1457232 RepID=A0A9X4QS74_9BACL|nr:SDR family NAD(P)-dependent oxidoreductase [Cohnella rhizosphaerae]MDG0809305.1 SDR family NAD(P)-dependent oxidoreductase [Cohnella rhizosphaerae]
MSGIIAITGASSGIGLATALKLAQEGWIVYAGTRHVERDRELYAGQDNLYWVEMEVTDVSSLEAAFGRIERERGNA